MRSLPLPRMRHLALPLVLGLGACDDVSDDDHDHDHDHGATTRMELTFTPQGGGAAETFVWSDPEDDGDPEIDPIVLTDGTTYDVDVTFWNDLEDEPEEVTPEVLEDATAHQVFFTGAAVQSPATGTQASAVIEQAYADTDENGDPLGLANTITTLQTGTGPLIVTLRHMPPENDSPVKTSTSAEDVAAGGFTAIGGDNDIQSEFDVTVE